jgi:quinolinate synthase
MHATKALPGLASLYARTPQGLHKKVALPTVYRHYTRIVGIGVGVAEAIGDGVAIGCAVAASVVAPATQTPARTIPTNHRFIDCLLLCDDGEWPGRPVPVLPAALNGCRCGQAACPPLPASPATPQVNPEAAEVYHYGQMGVIELPYTRSVAAETDPVFAPVEHVIPRVEWPLHAPYVAAINRLKRERNAVILAHNYQVPEIFYTVADIVGDSLALAMQAAKTDADVIVLCGVHFMAETAKLVNPSKTVLVPDLKAGCSLAESITAADVRLLRERYPGTPIVTYVNTSAEVKAESDVCVTSGNAVQIVEALGAPRVIFLPDEYLAKFVASKTKVEIVAWKGHCEVHERFSGEDIRRFREGDPTLVVLAHPECPPDVLAEADYVGSTQGMTEYVGAVANGDSRRAPRILMMTECSMADNVSGRYPSVEFVRPCNLCPHMKRNTLPKVLHSLEAMEYEVTVAPEVARRARRAVERMLEYSRQVRD